MHERVVTILMLIVAAIHLLPISGFFGAERIAMLYQIDLADPNLEILMRHRAILFGILGAFFAYAAFNSAVQPIAFAMAFISIVAFLYLSFSIGEYNTAIQRVVVADVVALICLIGAIALFWVNLKR